MNRNTTAAKAAAAAVLIAVAFVLRMIYEKLDDPMLTAVMVNIRNTIHISLLFAWVVSLKNRLININVRRLMLTVGGLLLFWLVDKIVKWDFTGSVTSPMVRYLWYGFYVGMLFIPTLGVFIIDYLGKPESYSHAKKLNYLLIPPTLMLIAVFTNDLHEKVFVFYNGIVNFNREYGYDWIYYIVMSWFIITGFYFVVMLLIKSRAPGSRKLQKMPLMVMGFAALFWVGYSMRLYDCDLTVMDCLIITLLLESAIQSGLLPSNSRHREIFDRTTVPVLIIDRDFQPHYVSGGAMPVSEEQLRKTMDATVDMGEKLLSSAPIRGGRVAWQDDITQLNDLRSRLKDMQEQLGEENVLLQAEVELKESRAKADEQNLLYDRIAREVKEQLLKADELLEKMESEPENTKEMLAKVCILGSYIKRRGNLLLLGENESKVRTKELEYCLRESLDNLNKADIYTSLRCRGEGEMKLGHILAAYDFYQMLAESFWDDMTALMVDLSCCADRMSLKIQMGCKEEIVPERMAGITARFGRSGFEIADEDVYIELTIAEGGEEK